MADLPNLLTRGDLAVLLGMSTEFVARREEELGLTAARVNPGGRMARYHRDAALAAEEGIPQRRI